MIGDNARELALLGRKTMVTPRIHFSAKYLPVTDEETYSVSDELFTTNFVMAIKYSPAANYKSQAKPFVLCSDLVSRVQGVAGSIRFNKLEDIGISERNKYALKFLLEFTNIKELYEMAKYNKYVPFPIAVDLKKYEKVCRENYKKKYKKDYPLRSVFLSPMEQLEKEYSMESYINQREAEWEVKKLEGRKRVSS